MTGYINKPLLDTKNKTVNIPWPRITEAGKITHYVDFLFQTTLNFSVAYYHFTIPSINFFVGPTANAVLVRAVFK